MWHCSRLIPCAAVCQSGEGSGWEPGPSAAAHVQTRAVAFGGGSCAEWCSLSARCALPRARLQRGDGQSLGSFPNIFGQMDLHPKYSSVLALGFLQLMDPRQLCEGAGVHMCPSCRRSSCSGACEGVQKCALPLSHLFQGLPASVCMHAHGMQSDHVSLVFLMIYLLTMCVFPSRTLCSSCSCF